jgi:hypothetical protein
MSRFLYTVEQIDRMLVNKMERLAQALAPDGERRGHEWVAINPARRDTKRGSFSINLATGVWKDFAAGDGAKLMPGLGLVAYLATEGDFKRAIGWAKDWLGLTDSAPDPALAQKLEAQSRRAKDQEAKRRKSRLNAAFAIFLNGVPLTGDCPASRYLRARAIDPLALEHGRFPRSLRFHPRVTHPHHDGHFPALIALQSLEGMPQGFGGIHRIYLEEKAGRWGKAFGGTNCKLSLGYQMGASIRIAQGRSKKRLSQAPAGEWVKLNEGIEDGLSLAMAMEGERVIAAYSLTALGNVVLPPQIGGVIVVAHNDTGNQKAEDALEAACLKLCDRHANVKVARMPAEFKDVNEVLTGGRRAS